MKKLEADRVAKLAEERKKKLIIGGEEEQAVKAKCVAEKAQKNSNKS